MPVEVPDVALRDQDGHEFRLGDYRGGALAVDFVYTQCRSVCTMLSAGFQRLARADVGLPLVTITFDPRDGSPQLKEYSRRYLAHGARWRFGYARDPRALDSLLRVFGIVVIPDGRGDFQHNAAVHLLDASGRLARVLDAGASPEEVVRARAALAVPQSVAVR